MVFLMSNKNMEFKDSRIPWIGQIPKHWEIKRLKFILNERKENNKPVKTDFILSLTNEKGVIPYSEKGAHGNISKDDITGYKLAYPNDIILNSMNVVIGSVGLSSYFGAISPVYYALYSKENSNIKFYNYIFQTSVFQNSLKGLGNGILEIRMRIPMSNLNNAFLPLPPLNEQEKIAEFLDKKCEIIDKRLNNLERKIKSLKEYKKSLISECVTKGLNPKNMEFKDSGISWIGQIPKHWEIRPLYFYFNERKNKNLFENEKNLLSLSYGKIIRKNIETKDGLLPENFNGYNIIEKDDIVFRLTDLQNDKVSLRTGLVKEKGIITSAYVTIKPKQKICIEFYHYLLHCYDLIKVFYNFGNGVRQSLTYKELSKMKILVPPLNEQKEIAEFLDKKCEKIDRLNENYTKQITALKEYKKSLIYECVTGKKRFKFAIISKIKKELE
ncbi:restriction endonuclease subunit S [Campylobacter sp.]|uniref:restriction endonuclease subunit S n=1 Tax=Campylobacter sp. TaxID=205 RepID=UPI002A504D33|nr:restriction endonuclease subunit S [Campylobacter sp.]MDD7090104.1 restriction endonuclease subunit S [Campylobacteraceae bacterium]